MPTPVPTVTPTPTSGASPTPTPLPATVFLRNHRSFSEGSTLFVVGEVVNGGSIPVYSVRVVATFYDAGDRLIAAQESFVFLTQTTITQANPFKIRLDNAPANIDRYELTLSWDEISVAEFDRVTIVREEINNENGVEIFGELRNDHPAELRNIVVVATFYDEVGQVLDVYQGTVDKPNLAPNEATQFRISTGADINYASLLVQTQGLLIR